MSKVRDILKSESDWCKDRFAQDSTGTTVSCHDNKACKRCLLGAIYKVYPIKFGQFDATGDGSEYLQTQAIQAEVIDKVMVALNSSGKEWSSIPEFNDHPDTTFEDVKKVLEQCDI